MLRKDLFGVLGVLVVRVGVLRKDEGVKGPRRPPAMGYVFVKRSVQADAWLFFTISRY